QLVNLRVAPVQLAHLAEARDPPRQPAALPVLLRLDQHRPVIALAPAPLLAAGDPAWDDDIEDQQSVGLQRLVYALEQRRQFAAGLRVEEEAENLPHRGHRAAR